GDQHRQHVLDALADLGIARDQSDGAIGVDFYEGVWLEWRLRPLLLRGELRPEVGSQQHAAARQRRYMQKGTPCDNHVRVPPLLPLQQPAQRVEHERPPAYLRLCE